MTSLKYPIKMTLATEETKLSKYINEYYKEKYTVYVN